MIGGITLGLSTLQYSKRHIHNSPSSLFSINMQMRSIVVKFHGTYSYKEGDLFQTTQLRIQDTEHDKLQKIGIGRPYLVTFLTNCSMSK